MSNLTDIQKRVAGRRVIVFGSGPTAQELLKRSGIVPAYLVDNEESVWGHQVWGYDVKPPQALGEESGDFLVIIGSSAVDDIARQLAAMGLRKGEQFINSPYLLGASITGGAALPELLISTIGTNGGLWHLDLQNEVQTKLVTGDCRGIARVGEHYLVVLEYEGLVILDREFAEVRRIEMERDMNYHGLAVDEQQRLLFVNETARDRVGVYDLDSFAKLRDIDLATREGNVQEQHHINGILFHEGMLYVTMFSRDGVWREGVWDDGAMLRVDPVTGEVLETVLHGLNQPHTILRDGDDWYSCNSMECQLLRNGGVECQLNGYLRGLDAAGDLLFIGQSTIRRLSRFDDRFNFLSLDTGVYVWNRATRVSTFVKVPADGIFDIKVVA